MKQNITTAKVSNSRKCTLIYNDRVDEKLPRIWGRWGWAGGRDYQETWGNFWKWWICSLSWIGQFHKFVHMSKLINCTNIYNLYVNYDSKKLFLIKNKGVLFKLLSFGVFVPLQKLTDTSPPFTFCCEPFPQYLFRLRSKAISQNIMINLLELAPHRHTTQAYV